MIITLKCLNNAKKCTIQWKRPIQGTEHLREYNIWNFISW